jgi:hypothetical protein
MNSSKARKAIKRQKVTAHAYRDHLLDLAFTDDFECDLPGLRTADLRHAQKRRMKKAVRR